VLTGDGEVFLNAYLKRAITLRQIGFSSYAEYLASDTWKGIKEEVFRRKGRKCFSCGSFASQVHHRDYKKTTLQGRRFKGLVPLCGHCHERISVAEDRKVRTVQCTNQILHEDISAFHKNQQDEFQQQAKTLRIGMDIRKLTRVLRDEYYSMLGYSPIRKAHTTSLVYGKMHKDNYLKQWGELPPGY
jgi:hypothetical protein